MYGYSIPSLYPHLFLSAFFLFFFSLDNWIHPISIARAHAWEVCTQLPPLHSARMRTLTNSLSFSLFFIRRVTHACRRLTALSIISRMVGLHARANLESACRDCGTKVSIAFAVYRRFFRIVTNETRGCLEARVPIFPLLQPEASSALFVCVCVSIF